MELAPISSRTVVCPTAPECWKCRFVDMITSRSLSKPSVHHRNPQYPMVTM